VVAKFLVSGVGRDRLTVIQEVAMAKRRYRRLTPEVRREICRLRAKGWTNLSIAREVGQAESTVHYVVRPFGGVFRRQLLEPRPTGRLTIEDRVEIYVGIQAGLSFTAIAGRLGKSVSTISREVGGRDGRGTYQPVRCHHRALERARRPKPCKLELNPLLSARVITDLRAWWSPTQIARRLRDEHPDDKAMHVSHETIYKSIYVQGRGELRRELAACLRSGRAQRQPQSRMERRGRIPNIVSISERPAEADDRAVPGHWEGDLILGSTNRSAIGTLVERATRFVILLHLPGRHGAVEVRDAMATAILQLPTSLRRSITWDRGVEMTEHEQFTIDTGVDIYFCDPHSPWQRGSNENTNGLLRQYFPKSTSLAHYTAADLQAAADSLNGRPRETLNWATPTEALTRFLATTA
jgi:IS30 family transposase